jgi:hypothetical protein
VLLAVGFSSLHARGADEEVFSGPQTGEKLVPFKALGVYGDLEGKEVDFVAQADGKPLLLVFMHELTRPSAALTRVLSEYARSRAKDGLQCGIVWLSEDRSATEAYLKQAKASLNLNVPVAISLDGKEGPGAFGLNRKVAMTILVANENKVAANFAYVQPSVTEAPQVAAAVVKVVGGEPPTLEQLNALAGLQRPARPARPAPPAAADDDGLREVLRPVIQKEATAEQLEKAVAAVEKYVDGNKARQQALGGIASRVVNSGRLETYGTPAAQEQLRAWAKKYGPGE